jgi:alpha-L-fucosidase
MSLLLNVTPDRHGVIPIEQQNVLRSVGSFLSKAGESIYNTRGGPWQPVNGQYGFTYNGNKVYIHILPGYSGETITTPAFGNNNIVTGAYNVYDKTSLSYIKNSDTSITISGLNRSQHIDDTVVGITLSTTLDTTNHNIVSKN